MDSSHTRRQGGTGLGLYICRKMAEAIGARIWLARSDAAGSEFCLFVPERHLGGEPGGGVRRGRRGSVDDGEGLTGLDDLARA